MAVIIEPAAIVDDVSARRFLGMTIQSIDDLTATNYDRIIVESLDNLDFAWDGMHLTAAGNDVVAAGLVDPVLSMLR